MITQNWRSWKYSQNVSSTDYLKLLRCHPLVHLKTVLSFQGFKIKNLSVYTFKTSFEERSCGWQLLLLQSVHASSSLASLLTGGRSYRLHCRLWGVLTPASTEAQPQQTREPGDALLCTFVDSIDQRLFWQVWLLCGTFLFLLGGLFFTATVK